MDKKDCNGLEESAIVYPTELGWKLLKEKVRNEQQLLPSIFEDHWNHYKNDKDDSYKITRTFKDAKVIYSEFMFKSEYARKDHDRVESPMQEYLRVKGITLEQFKMQMAAIAWYEYD
jgi:hypothetical protein